MNIVARMLGDKKNYSTNINLVPVERFEVFQCPQRTMTHEGRFLDYVVNALDYRGPMDANCQLDPANGKWVPLAGAINISRFRQPAEVAYIIDAADEVTENTEGVLRARE